MSQVSLTSRFAVFLLVGFLAVAAFSVSAEHPRPSESGDKGLRSPNSQEMRELSPQERRRLIRKKRRQEREKMIRERREKRFDRLHKEHGLKR